MILSILPAVAYVIFWIKRPGWKYVELINNKFMKYTAPFKLGRWLYVYVSGLIYVPVQVTAVCVCLLYIIPRRL